jgi:hypothetical protein
MPRKRAAPSIEIDDRFTPGVYLTDGSSLFNVVGVLPHEPLLRLVEDCSTLEILMVHVDGLSAPGVRQVEALTAAQPHGTPSQDHDIEEVAELSSLMRTARARI